MGKIIARQTGRSVYTLDLRNHGDSGHSEGDESTYPAMAVDIKHFMESHSMTKVTLMGHSMGGRAVFQFAFTYHQLLERFIAVDISPVSMPPTLESLLSYVQVMQSSLESINSSCETCTLLQARRAVDAALTPVVKEKFIRDFLTMNLMKESNDGTSNNSNKFRWKFNLKAFHKWLSSGAIFSVDAPSNASGQSNNLSGLKCLFVYGGESAYFRKKDEDVIRSQLFPSASFHCIPQAGHYLHVEQPQSFLQVIIPFLSR